MHLLGLALDSTLLSNQLNKKVKKYSDKQNDADDELCSFFPLRLGLLFGELVNSLP